MLEIGVIAPADRAISGRHQERNDDEWDRKGIAAVAGLSLALCGGGHGLKTADGTTTATQAASDVQGQETSSLTPEQQQINLYG